MCLLIAAEFDSQWGHQAPLVRLSARGSVLFKSIARPGASRSVCKASLTCRTPSLGGAIRGQGLPVTYAKLQAFVVVPSISRERSLHQQPLRQGRGRQRGTHRHVPRLLLAAPLLKWNTSRHHTAIMYVYIYIIITHTHTRTRTLPLRIATPNA